MSLPEVKVSGNWPVLRRRGAADRGPRGPGAGRYAPRRPPGGTVRWLRRRWPVLTAALLCAAVTIAYFVLRAASYQPLGYGNTGALAYPGLPAGQGIRTVNTFGGIREDVYIPPQRAGYTFFLFADISNYGSRTVTIDSVMLPPGSALTQAGPVRYGLVSDMPGAPGIPPASHVLHSVPLSPAHEVFLAIPVRSEPCWMRYNSFFVTVPDFQVTYRWLFFTHTAAVPWGMQNDALILHLPLGRSGQPGVVCVPG